MQSEGSQQRILAELLRAGAPLSLQEVAFRVGLSPSTTLRHLMALVAAGRVVRTGHHKTAAYEPAPKLEAAWVGSEGNRMSRMRWESPHPVDWRFPLVSRVPDGKAQASLRRFFAESLARGFLTPWLLERPAYSNAKHRVRHEDWLRNLRDPRQRDALWFIVFGSCARGDARAESDADVLILGPPEGDYGRERFVEALGFSGLAAELNLGLDRPLQVQEYPLNEFLDEDLAHFRGQVRREGILVHSTKPHASTLEGVLGV